MNCITFLSTLFQNNLDYETFVKIVEMQKEKSCLTLMVEKLKRFLRLRSVEMDASFNNASHANDDL